MQIYLGLLHVSVQLQQVKSQSVQIKAWQEACETGLVKQVVKEIKDQVKNGHREKLETQLGKQLLNQICSL